LKLNVVIAESALELVPDEVSRRPAVINDVKRRGVPSSGILLDRSTHHSAMLGLEEDFKRGRPDIIHMSLLAITGSPLYQKGMAKVYIHTRDNVVLELKQGTKPPKNYFRFRSLIEKILVNRESDVQILYHEIGISDLLKLIKPDCCIGLSVLGRRERIDDFAAEMSIKENPVVLIGGFPHGHFSSQTIKLMDRVVRIDEMSLDAHVVASRVTYEVEKRVLP
jgi:rRNA small subunit pseudouridine methyltransferase Nep1